MQSIAEFFRCKPAASDAVIRLGEDPVALARILVLFRVVLADGVVQPDELRRFEEICEAEFGIGARDLADLHAVLESPQGRAAESEAYLLLAGLDRAGRERLIGQMRQIAGAGLQADAESRRLIRRAATMLDMPAMGEEA